MTPRIAWLAEKDGIGHAQLGRNPRTVCGRPATDPRHAWPRTSLHPECVEAVKQLETDAAAPTRSR